MKTAWVRIASSVRVSGARTLEAMRTQAVPRGVIVKPHLWLIKFIGIIVPSRLRADWRREWEAELCYRETLLADWDKLDRPNKLALLWHSLGAFMDALWLQPRRWEDEMIQDLRFGVRMLLKSKVFTAVAVLSLALGIGANTIVFSLINTLFFSSPPGVTAPGQIVGICRLYISQHRPFPDDICYPDYRYYRDRNTVFSGLASQTGAHLADGDLAVEIQANVVSENYFSVLGVRPFIGRFFLPEEDMVPGRNPVVVLSHPFWQRRFNGDADCIGQPIKLNGVTFTVVGVAPAGFRGAHWFSVADVWLPSMMAQVAYRGLDILSRDSDDFELIGRLKPGLTREQAQAEMTVLAHQLEESYPQTNKDTGVFLYPLKGVHPVLRSQEAELPRVLAVTVSCLLLIACANLAGLLLARGATRQKEIAIRLALGSRRGRLIRQLLTESVLLSLLGGAVGWLIAYWAGDLLGSYYFTEVEGVRPFYVLSFDGYVLLFSLSLAVFTGVIFGLAPAIQASRPALVPALKDDSSAFGYRSSRLRAGFLIIQVALSVVLLIGAGLMIQSLHNLKWDSGFDARNVVFIRMKPHLSGYDSRQSQTYFRNVQRRLEAVAGVQSVAFAAVPPLRDWGGVARVSLPGEQPAREQDVREVKPNTVTPGFFETLRIPLIGGRSFDERDLQEGRRAVIVNETLAQQLWPDQEALGQTVVVDDRPHEVVGVARYDNFRRSGEAPKPFIFRAGFGSNRMLVRLQGNPQAMLPVLRREILAVDPNVAISEELPVIDMIENFFAPVRMAMGVLGYAGGLALLLSAIGLYGVLALAVNQRTREIGIRMALGARGSDVSRMILREGLRLTSLGIILGVVSALALTRFLSRYLYGVAQNDVWTFVAVASLLTLVAILACWLPARSATKVDPMVALRHD
jgi:macrolide transport system ATP-binding/permease protein